MLEVALALITSNAALGLKLKSGLATFVIILVELLKFVGVPCFERLLKYCVVPTHRISRLYHRRRRYNRPTVGVLNSIARTSFTYWGFHANSTLELSSQ